MNGPESIPRGSGIGEVPNTTYGFIGIGVMGWGMAKNLRAKLPESSKLVICEINTERRDEFLHSTEGLVEPAQTPKEVAEKADIIITMLPKGEHVLDAFTNPDTGLLAGSTNHISNRKKLFIECSTIETAKSVELGKKVTATGLGDFVDSPVSGGPQGSDAGTLTFMVGGSPELFAKVKPILALMGKEDSIFHCGKQGAGLATKQLNNYLAYVSYLGLCEVMNTGMRYGLDPKVLAGVINVSSGMCWNSLNHIPVKGVVPSASSNRDFEGGFSIDLCKGVIDMAVELMDDVGAKSVLGPVVKGVYDRGVVNEKCKGKESRSVYRLFSEDDGKELDGL